MTTLEQAVREAWVAWGYVDVKWTACDDCHEVRVCRRGRRGPWLCMECFDQR